MSSTKKPEIFLSIDGELFHLETNSNTLFDLDCDLCALSGKFCYPGTFRSLVRLCEYPGDERGQFFKKVNKPEP